ncbi:hypothetical protein PFICI_10256 [Pestalotiopsis fici W106-1]|uniref:NADH:ubiquinone oxidoreductase intermediate-associated protein 30 domain-containing protein n=1 Tax=Pestalotiopsis fici (strain W106-1 / CGMCC3.15140) TaxID=1229662 RepID=W3WWK9_PESFW|nr:uncharacterized protein PFICI_10256 [Pestalotiopsis fici W106-1]ETS78194.1 hypothetical protein PFICI_10256 [Pestalotiopsis fici W106-1]
MSPYHFDLFGGAAGWDARCWTSSDDRVRGGKSQSYLECTSGQHTQVSAAIFRGNLDIKTLGGAGFASQRTTDDQGPWDLSRGDGILLKLLGGDGKKYTLTLKDQELPKRPDGREQSTVSWEYDFTHEKDHKAFVPWSAFKPTYRGKPKSDAEPLDLKSVRRVSIMMRSFFGEQQGPFRLEIESISVAEDPALSKDDDARQSIGQYSEKSGHVTPKKTWRNYLSCGLL